MASIALALALFLQAQTTDPGALLLGQAPDKAAPAEAPPAEEAAPEDRLPAGAPKDDYQFVAWCYGSLRGYLDLHDQVMPEVTRIESTFRPPERKLSDDLKVYADMQKEGRAQLKDFQAALTAAEKASIKPINKLGAQAVAKGHDLWTAGADVTPARLAQEWMSWALPARCEVTAKSLKARATLMGASLRVNAEPDPPAADAAPEKPTDEKPVADAPPAATDAAQASEAPAAAEPSTDAPVAPPPTKAARKSKKPS